MRLATPILRNLVFFLSLVSCTQTVNLETVEQNFHEHKGSYVLLKNMMKEDKGKESCFIVGIDRIGDYWQGEKSWSHKDKSSERLSLNQVLEKQSLLKSRYTEYLLMQDKVGIYRSVFCHRIESEISHYYVHRSGLAISGCTVDIVNHAVMPVSRGKKEYGSFTEIIELQEAWYIERSCT